MSKSEQIRKIKEVVAMSAYLYGPRHGRNLWNTLWDIARIVGDKNWVEALGDDPRKVCEKLKIVK